MTTRRNWTTLAFSCLMVVFFAAVTKVSLGFQPLAREFPLAIGIMGLAFALFNVAADVVALVRADSQGPTDSVPIAIPTQAMPGADYEQTVPATAASLNQRKSLTPHVDLAAPSGSSDSGPTGMPTDAATPAEGKTTAQPTDDRAVGRRGLYFWLWIAALGLLAWLVGLIVAAIVFLVAFLAVEARMRWPKILLVVLAFVALEFAGVRLVDIQLPPGKYAYVGDQLNALLSRIF